MQRGMLGGVRRWLVAGTAAVAVLAQTEAFRWQPAEPGVRPLR